MRQETIQPIQVKYPGQQLNFKQLLVFEFSDDNEIINESFAFFIAGFETSSSTLNYALLELAQNPQIQDKLRNEIQATLKKHGNQITYDSIQEMKYLDQVVLGSTKLFNLYLSF